MYWVYLARPCPLMIAPLAGLVGFGSLFYLLWVQVMLQDIIFGFRGVGCRIQVQALEESS